MFFYDFISLSNRLDEMKSEEELQAEKESCEREARINKKLNDLGI